MQLFTLQGHLVFWPFGDQISIHVINESDGTRIGCTTGGSSDCIGSCLDWWVSWHRSPCNPCLPWNRHRSSSVTRRLLPWKVSRSIGCKVSDGGAVLKVIREAQGQHGLKHGDYHRYRSYCRRRIKRLRKSLAFVQATSAKSRSSFHQKKVTEELVCDAQKSKKDPLRYLLIVLMSSERCWSHAMALKQEANTEHRKKFHLLRKLEKAVLYARVLHGLCTGSLSICDARTKLESEAYLYFMRGMFLFERQEWKSSSSYLRKAQAIYTKLEQAISDQDVALLYRQRVDEMQPTLRYCAFSLGEDHASAMELLSGESGGAEDFLVSKLDQLILQTQEKQAVTLQEVTWLGAKISVQDEKIRTFLLLVQDKKGLKLNQLERLLFECRECIQSVRDAKDKGKLYCYLQFLRNELTCQRNQELIDSLQNAVDMIRPYEVIVASIEDLKALPFQQHFENLNEVNLLLEKLDSEIRAFRAFRCYCIAKSGKVAWKETITLLHRSCLYAREALDHQSTSPDLRTQLTDLVRKAEAEKFSTYANGLMDDDSGQVVDTSRVTHSLQKPIDSSLITITSVTNSRCPNVWMRTVKSRMWRLDPLLSLASHPI